MTSDRREILERVASGDLTPEEAETLLSAPDARPPAPAGDVHRVRVVAGFGALSIVGDPSVRTAEVDGVHTASIEGGTLEIRGETGGTDGGVFAVPGVFEINLGARRRGRRVRVRTGPGAAGTPLRIRMNPALELDAKLDAGPMSIAGLDAALRARAGAGPLTIEDVTGPFDVGVNAGAIRITTKVIAGESRVRSDAGGIRIELDPASSVRVSASAALGKVIVPGGDEAKGGIGASREALIGAGDATLRVETAMGSINVSVR